MNIHVSFRTNPDVTYLCIFPQKLNIALPELKTIDVLPALDTPTAMKGLLEHNDSMFSFEF